MAAEQPAITAETVRDAAQLSQLALSDEEVERMRAQLAALLGYVSKLQEVDVAEVAPTGHPFGQTIVARDDEVQPSPGASAMLEGAPATDGEHFLVPKVIDQD